MAHISKPWDVRDVEASILAKKTIDCIKPGLYLDAGNFENAERINSCIEFSENDKKRIFIGATLSNFTAEIKNLEFGELSLGKYFDPIKQGADFSPSISANAFSYYLIDKENRQFILKLEIVIK